MSDSQQLHVISGKINLLRKAEGKVNLLESLQGSASAVGAGLALGDLDGAAASAASLMLYDGEAVEHVGFALDEQVVIGTFQHASFEDGDDIKAVVSTLDGGILFAHAVVRVRDGLLWMPYNLSRGRRAMAKSTAKFGATIIGFICLMAAIMTFAQGGPLLTVGVILVVAPCVILPIGYLVYRDGLPEADSAERIFKVLGFKKPEVVDLSPFSLARESVEMMLNGRYIFRLRKALAAYGSLSKARPTAAAPKAQTK